MAMISRLKLSEVAIIFGLVFLFSAVGCSKKDNNKRFTLNEPTIRLASNNSSVSIRAFQANPQAITSAHVINFENSKADHLTVTTTCSVKHGDEPVQNLEPVSWHREFRNEVAFLELLPHALALAPQVSNDTVICSFDFIAHEGASTHSFRLMNVNINPSQYTEGILWDQIASASAANFTTTTYERSISENVRRIGFDLVCFTGAQRVYFPENSRLNVDVTKNMVELMMASGEITWAEVVQDCVLARIENGVVLARSRGFVLSFAPNIRISYAPNADRRFVAVTSSGAGTEFQGSFGVISIKNESEIPVRVVLPAHIPNAVQVNAIIDTRDSTPEVARYCEYGATLHLGPGVGQVVQTGDQVTVRLGGFEQVQLTAELYHSLIGGRLTARLEDPAQNNRGREIFVALRSDLSPMAQVFEGAEPVEGERAISMAGLESSARVKIVQQGGAESRNIIGGSSRIDNRNCRVLERRPLRRN